MMSYRIGTDSLKVQQRRVAVCKQVELVRTAIRMGRSIQFCHKSVAPVATRFDYFN